LTITNKIKLQMANNQQAKQTINEQKKEEQTNLIRVGGTRRTEAYVKIAEQLLTQYEEIEISGLGNSKLFCI
jgi:primosomal protein N'